MEGQGGSAGSDSMPGASSGDVPMSEEEVANNIPLQNLKSNQAGQREVFIDSNVNDDDMIEQQMSPGMGRRFDF